MMGSIFDSREFNENLFFPRQDSMSPPPDAEDIYVEVEENIHVHVRRHESALARFSLLFFHGNGEVVSDYDGLAGAFTALGGEMVVCDYRGYGKSEGSPSLRNTLKDASVIYNHLKEHKKILPSVCVMGRSLGSAPAIELCSTLDEIACCVIESGYADPIPLVQRRGLRIDQTTPEEDALFNNSKKIANIKCPLLIMHGEDDFLISPQEAELNYRQAGAKVKILKILEGVGHNDMMMARDGGYFTCLKNFLDNISWND
ncbi:MAG: alpha/beta hydrolase [Nitrospinaceae bacterium]|nr:MAG: alpha/beta hydrolase [Nitrospinaceae bacterium]